MKNKLLLGIITILSLAPVCEARIKHHDRNDGVTLGGGPNNSLKYKDTEITFGEEDIDGSSPAECVMLPVYLKKNTAILLSKVDILTGKPKSEEKIQADEIQFYDIILAHVRKGGDYGFKASGYDFSKPEQEYLHTHKIEALKLISKAQTKNIRQNTRAEANFLLAQIMQKRGNLATEQEIFNWYHKASISAPNTEFGAKAAMEQLKMIGQKKIMIEELPLADFYRMVSLIKHYGASSLWRKAGFTHEWQIDDQIKQELIYGRIADAKVKAIELSKNLRQKVARQKILLPVSKKMELRRQNAYHNLQVGIVH